MQIELSRNVSDYSLEELENANDTDIKALPLKERFEAVRVLVEDVYRIVPELAKHSGFLSNRRWSGGTPGHCHAALGRERSPYGGLSQVFG